MIEYIKKVFTENTQPFQDIEGMPLIKSHVFSIKIKLPATNSPTDTFLSHANNAMNNDYIQLIYTYLTNELR
ncbi:hypothetical protein [Lunatimonas salinarum]|uniref:hypothetical protein n=1 Tax=Lunatimonas salinarum TaxID=1774590 RepID=UPI001AE00217|nr:hypothetical protein [Lunatimonas salinarum]